MWTFRPLWVKDGSGNGRFGWGRHRHVTGSARGTTVPPTASTSVDGATGKTSVHVPAAALVEPQQRLVDVDGQVVPERRHPADGEPGGGADRVGVRPADGAAAAGRREARLGQPVVAGDERHDRRPVDEEHERLHDLPDLDADGGRGIGRRLRALGVAADGDVEAALGGGGDHGPDVAVHGAEATVRRQWGRSTAST
jgi:hypothetical protein